MFLKGFYFITDHRLSLNGNIKDVKIALENGVKIVQYRDKTRQKKDFYHELFTIQKLCNKFQAKFIVNDFVDLAIKIRADGIHLGQKDLEFLELAKKKFKIIGISVNSLKLAKQAENDGATYIGVGSIFQSQTKSKLVIGVKKLQEIKKFVKIPIAAIGGINLNNAKQVISSNADMICAISSSFKNGLLKKNIQAFKYFFEV